MGIIFSCACVFWYPRQVAHCFQVFYISVFLFNKYPELCTRNLIFSIPIWLLCSCWDYLCLKLKWDYYCLKLKWDYYFLPFMDIPPIIANLFLFGQYSLMHTSSLLCSQPWIIYAFSSRWVSSSVAICMSCMDMHTGMFIDVMMAFMPILIPLIF